MKNADTKAKLKLPVYTFFKNALVMGGDIWQPKKTEVEVELLGKVKGISLYGFETDKGYRVAEGYGGIVGDSFETVKKEIEDCNDAMLFSQLEQSRVNSEKAELISNEDFFKVYNKAK